MLRRTFIERSSKLNVGKTFFFRFQKDPRLFLTIIDAALYESLTEICISISIGVTLIKIFGNETHQLAGGPVTSAEFTTHPTGLRCAYHRRDAGVTTTREPAI
jgi:hypothetical protein